MQRIEFRGRDFADDIAIQGERPWIECLVWRLEKPEIVFGS